MNTKRMIYTDSDGNVRRVTAASGVIEKITKSGATEAEAWDLIRKGHGIPANALNLIVVEDGDLPYFGSFGRFAWRQDGPSAPVFDMPKARVIKTDQIRVERKMRFTVLDVDYMRADEPPGDIAEKDRIIAVRKRLRDLPVTIQPDLDAITTPEALDAWQPKWPE